jgi:hypothetical protein
MSSIVAAFIIGEDSFALALLARQPEGIIVAIIIEVILITNVSIRLYLF